MKMRTKGFTLVELLVVIAIIAILAAILFPVFSNAKEKARSTQCIANMNQLGKAMRLYLDDYNGIYPGAVPLGGGINQPSGYYYQGTGSQNGITGSDGAYLFNIYERGGIWPYVMSREIYVCPSDPNQFRPRTTGGVLKTPKTTREFGLSYSMNLHLTETGMYGKRASDSDIRRPTKTVVFIDEGAGSLASDGQVHPIVDGHFGPEIDWPSMIHYDGTNYTFTDGHAEWCALKDMSRLEWGTLTIYRIPQENIPEHVVFLEED